MRRFLSIILVVVVVLVLAVAAVWLARVPIAERLLAERLTHHGYPQAQFTIAALGWSEGVISRIALDPDAGPTAERVTVHYDPLRLVGGNVRHVTVTVAGLRARVDLEARAGDGGAAVAAPVERGPERLVAMLAGLPNLHVDDARIEARGLRGPWRLRLQGDLEQPGRGDAAPTAVLDGSVRNERLRVKGRFRGRLDGGAANLYLTLTEDDGFAVDLSTSMAPPWDEARAHVEYAVTMPSDADLPWALLPGPRPAAGTIRLNGSARGRLESLARPSGLRAVFARLAAGGWSADYHLVTEDLGFTARFAGLDLEAAGSLSPQRDGVTVSSDGSGGATVAEVHEPLWSRLSPPRALVPYVAGPMRVTWEAGEVAHLRVPPPADDIGPVVELAPRLELRWPERDGRATLAAHARAELAAPMTVARLALADIVAELRDVALPRANIRRARLSGSVDGLPAAPAGDLVLALEAPRVDLDGATLRGVRARLPLALARSGDTTRVDLQPDGSVRAEGWSAGAGIEARGGLAAALTGGQLELGGTRAWVLDIEPEPLALALARGGADGIALELDGGRVRAAGRLAGGRTLERVEVADLSLALPRRDLRASGVSATLRPGTGGAFAEFSAERVAYAPFAPVAVRGRVERTGGGLALDARGTAAGGVPVTFAGRADAVARTGRVRVDVPAFRFEPGALQPGDLVPALGALEDARGGVEGQATLIWSDAAIDGDATLALDALSFRAGIAEVEGLGGEVVLSDLVPPRAERRQEIRIARIGAGVPLTDASVRFGIGWRPAQGTVVDVVEARADVLGGTARVRDWSFDPAGQLHTVGVDVEDVDLGQLLGRIEVAALSGTGRVSGRVPVTVVDGELAVRDARLRADSGRVQLRSERAGEILSERGPRDGRIARALRDFDYDALEVSVARAPQGETRVGIHMRGRSPEVSGSDPLDFDIALAGDFMPLLRRLADGGGLSDDLVEESLDLRSVEER